MSKLTQYASMFGGVLANIEEYGGECKHLAFIKAMEQLDAFVESKFEKAIDDDVRNWLNSKVIDGLHIPDKFCEMCKLGNLEMVKLLYDMGIRSKTSHTNVYECAIESGNLDLIKWLYSNKFEIQHVLFVEACEKGNIDIVKWFADKTDIHDNDDLAIRVAAGHGHIDVTNWLLEMKCNIHSDKNDVLRIACIEGNLDVFKWLVLEHKCDIGTTYYGQKFDGYDDYDSVEINLCMSISSTHNNSEIFKWVDEQLEPLERVSYNDIELSFKEFANNNNVDMVDWIHDNYPIDKEWIMDVFESLIRSKGLEIVTLLHTYGIKYNKNFIKKAGAQKMKDLLRKLFAKEIMIEKIKKFDYLFGGKLITFEYDEKSAEPMQKALDVLNNYVDKGLTLKLDRDVLEYLDSVVLFELDKCENSIDIFDLCCQNGWIAIAKIIFKRCEIECDMEKIVKCQRYPEIIVWLKEYLDSKAGY